MASSETFFACKLSSVVSIFESVRCVRSCKLFGVHRRDAVVRGHQQPIDVSDRLLEVDACCRRSMMSCAAFTMAVTVDGALGM